MKASPPPCAVAAHRRITTAITTLDYCISWNSLHAAHIVGFKEERDTNVIAVDVSRHAIRMSNR